ncbi:MAG TPA: hypothetical protein DCR13_05715 [Gammaproteobacteria bacterium]|nr:hypothetical protein [Gammaproteobacteria bacterium]HAU06641.1 hypothetical protein [Gammaproteobacteria bacterium]
MFESIKYKTTLKNAFSDCFEPLKSVLGNVPIPMQTDRYITGAILGTCRGYAEAHHTSAKVYASLVDTVFEEIYRQNSIAVQTQTETWLTDADETFMASYYHAKEKAAQKLDLTWLQDYAKAHFDVAFEVHHST